MAISSYQSAVDIDPTKVEIEIWNDMGLAYLAKEDYAQAMQAFQQILTTIEPSNAEAWYNRGISYGEHNNAMNSISGDMTRAAKLGHKKAQEFCRLRNWNY